jgi:sterol desaturase/sphingolipid hydroxylase (fatty acid hydroxylase superfamily)
VNPIVFAIPVFMLTVIVEALLARRRGLAVYDTADAITSLHLGMLSQVVAAFSSLFLFGIYILVWKNFHVFELSASDLRVWLFALIAYDFLYYWFHRAGHEVAVFWAAHSPHHSSEYYNLSTALRQSSTAPFAGWVFYLPMALIGVPPLAFITVGLIDLLYQYWVHTELVGKLGWFDRVFVSPSNHRVHHGQNEYCIDRNYGGILILWDRMFGTFTEERDAETIVYGVRKPLKSWNPLWGNAHVFHELWLASVAAKGMRAKLAVWIARPRDTVPAEGSAEFDAGTFRRFTTATAPAIQRYAAVQYAVLVLPVTHFIAVQPGLGDVGRIVYALLILASTLSVGALMEGRRFARAIEQVRVVVLGVAFAASPEWFGWQSPDWLKILVALFMFASAFQLARIRPSVTAAESGTRALTE